MFYNTLHYSLFTHIEISMRCACAVVHKIEILGGCGPYTVYMDFYEDGTCMVQCTKKINIIITCTCS